MHPDQNQNLNVPQHLVSSRCVYNAQGDMLCTPKNANKLPTHNLDAYGQRLSSIAQGVPGIELFTQPGQQKDKTVVPYEALSMFENSAKITSDMLMALPTFPL